MSDLIKLVGGWLLFLQTVGTVVDLILFEREALLGWRLSIVCVNETSPGLTQCFFFFFPEILNKGGRYQVPGSACTDNK